MNQSELIEVQLIEEAKHNASAFVKLYSYYVKKIYNFFYYHTLDVSEAEDLTSYVFEKVLVNIKGYKVRKEESGKNPTHSFSAWIFRIAHNLLIDFYRRRRTHESIENRDFASNINIEDNLERKERIRELIQALSFIPNLQREIIILKYHQSLTNKEIGKIIGKSEGAVKQIVRRALGQLRSRMEKG